MASQIAATCQVLAQLRQQDTAGDTPLHKALAASRYDEEPGWWSRDRYILNATEFVVAARLSYLPRDCSSHCLLMHCTAGNGPVETMGRLWQVSIQPVPACQMFESSVYDAAPRLGGVSVMPSSRIFKVVASTGPGQNPSRFHWEGA